MNPGWIIKYFHVYLFTVYLTLIFFLMGIRCSVVSVKYQSPLCQESKIKQHSATLNFLFGANQGINK